MTDDRHHAEARRQPRRTALGAPPLWQPARHHRRRLRHVARLRHRRARPSSPTSTSTSPSPRRRRMFGIIALALTFVVITGEIDLSLPLDHGARHRGLLPRRHANGGLPLVRRRCSPPSPPARSAAGSTASWWRGSTSPRWSSPSAPQFLFRGLELVLMNGTGVPLTADAYPQLHAIFREPLFGVLPVQTVWMVLPRGRALVAAQPHPFRRAMSSSSATIRPARG